MDVHSIDAELARQQVWRRDARAERRSLLSRLDELSSGIRRAEQRIDDLLAQRSAAAPRPVAVLPLRPPPPGAVPGP